MRPPTTLLTRLSAVLLILLGLCLSSIAKAADSLAGYVGVGTWLTQAEFRDLKISRGGQLVFESDFSKGLAGLQVGKGQWTVVDGALRQNDTGLTETRVLFGSPEWDDYTLTVRARKLSGKEGFLLHFAVPNAEFSERSWWNVGGWDNKAHALQRTDMRETRLPGSIETGRWYELKLEVQKNKVSAYLDNRLVQTLSRKSDAEAQRTFPRALIPDMLADPSIVEHDGVFYCFATTDGMGRGLATSGLPVVWKSRDFLNWSFEGSIMPASFDAKYWAPSIPVLRNDRWYLFPTLDNNITAVVSKSLEGPFLTLDGKEVRTGSGWKPMDLRTGHPIDAEIIRAEEDGRDYMLLSRRRLALMKPDLSGIEGEPFEIKTKRGGYSEGPALFRRNGIYYYLYTLGGSESYRYAYMMSRGSLRGPWEAPEQDIIASSDRELGIHGPGHGCFLNLAGTSRWFFIYLEYGRSSTNRQIVAAPMYFNPDGTIRPIKLAFNGVGALRRDPDYERPNLALGATSTASSTAAQVRIPPTDEPDLNRIEVFDTKNAHDASNGSRWMARADGGQAWFQLDLGREVAVNRTELYFVQPTLGHAYQLEASLDGKTWRPCGGHEDVQIRSPHKDSAVGTARHLRVTILKGTPGLWEFRVY